MKQTHTSAQPWMHWARLLCVAGQGGNQLPDRAPDLNQRSDVP